MFSPRKYLPVLLLLLLLFTAYNYTLYTNQSDYGRIRLSEKALQGEKHWRENNCNACHQLYGLGGYLGPDLTNVYSFRKKDGNYLKAMFNSGVKAMPRFDFNETEKEELLQFFIEVDQTGTYPNTKATINPDGWVKIQYKKEIYEH
ncbi:c-type cytochrome [Flavobacterium sedimenticola]|uniref:Cytochrome c n=1 Tax=Flavobacterium sedimenticola TaxID=3043286 RepID=A0ABT6XMC8_9FLAO|nr:cytochrome c [Flavobacterium sedimenticola]MDI9256243.1 cytochrome c [Flavobacterium sedimenticola]